MDLDLETCKVQGEGRRGNVSQSTGGCSSSCQCSKVDSTRRAASDANSSRGGVAEGGAQQRKESIQQQRQDLGRHVEK